MFRGIKLENIITALSLTIAAMTLSVEAQESGEGDFPVMLVVFVTADDKCGLLEPGARDTLDALLNFALNDEDVPPQNRQVIEELMESGELAEDLDCNSDEAEGLAKMMEELITDMERDLAKMMDQSSSTDASPFMGPESLVDQHDFMQQLPMGQLTAFEGCWGGIIGVWEAQLCFDEGGDSIELTMNPPDRAFSCTLKGPARFNGVHAIMYALPISPDCQNRGMLSHFTNRCTIPEEERIECHGLTMVDGENTYVDQEFEAYVAGIFPLARTAAGSLAGSRMTFTNHISDLPTGMLGNSLGCYSTDDFFGTSATLCISESPDTAILEMDQSECSIEGRAVRVGESAILMLLEAERGCGHGGATFMTNSCSEVEGDVLECFTYAMQDGWNFAAHEDEDGRVPHLGQIVWHAND